MSQLMKNLQNSIIFSNFPTNYQFAKDIGIELLKGSATPEHIEVLKKSVEGIKDYINLLEEQIKEREIV